MFAGLKIRGGKDLHEEFVAQFVGKSVATTFQIAREPADLLFVPAKIRAEAGRIELAESIVKEIGDLAKLLAVPGKLNLTFKRTPKVLHKTFQHCARSIFTLNDRANLERSIDDVRAKHSLKFRRFLAG